MPGYGTGVPISFACPIARRNRLGSWANGNVPPLPPGHDVTRTGRTKPAPNQGRLHPRTLSTAHEYRCACGHVGWSYHHGVLDCPLAGCWPAGHAVPDTARP